MKMSILDCKLPAAPSSGVVKFGVNVNTAVYTCNEGYSLKGHSERFCQSDGTGWNLTEPECGKNVNHTFALYQ